MFVLEGLRICDDAMQNKIRFDKLIVSQTAFSKYNSEIFNFAKNSEECFEISDSLFKKISDTTSPQGILALAKKPQQTPVIDKNGRYIALENINDPSNLGAISRTAEALGVSGIILSNNGCDPFSPKSLRASMGTLLRLPLIITDNFSATLKNSGLTLYACVVENTAKSITEVSFCSGSAVLIGNEANGLTNSAKEICDLLVTIPMKGSAESLNAAAAAAISIWEMMK